MFIDIEETKSPLAVEIMLLPYKRGRLAPDKKSYLPKEPIMVTTCFEILSSTNYPRNIKDMLVCISELPKKEQILFKEAVLATFTRRDQPDDILELGLQLAENNGFLEQFNEARKFENKDFLCSTPKPAYGIKCDYFIDAKMTTIRSVDDDIMIGNKSIKDYTKIICSGYRVVLRDVKELPEIDVSDCSAVLLTNCDFSNQTYFVFKDNAQVKLDMAKNLPPDIDFSQCSEVSLCSCNLGEQHNLSFKDGATVNLYKAYNLPPQLDFSKCSNVNLEGCDLSQQPNLRFKNGAQVSLCCAYNLPSVLDVSPCEGINLYNADFSKVERLVFKNREQMEISHIKLSDDWKGNLVFADECSKFDSRLKKFINNIWSSASR